MRTSEQRLNDIYDRTTGYCHICSKKLAFSNYGRPGRKGAWEIEHSNARDRGGTNHLNNLYAACIKCNREKGTVTTRTARAWHGRKKAPLSRGKRKAARTGNAILGSVVGGVLGSVAGPWGAAAGLAIGARLGYKANPD